MAPPSARQLASPTRWKFSSPLSPSIRVVQPLPGTHEGIDEQAESAIAAVSTSRRFIGVPPLAAEFSAPAGGIVAFPGCSPIAGTRAGTASTSLQRSLQERAMRIRSIAIALAALGFSVAAAAQDRLVRFEGGIGVIPARVGGAANTVRGVNPGGQVWVITRLSVDVRTDGRISVDGRGLLLGGGDNIGTNGAQSVRARLFCGGDGNGEAFDSDLVPLEADGDFRI